MDLSPIGNTLLVGTQVITAAAAAVGLFVSAWQIRLSRKVSAVELILQLDDQIAEFNEVQEEIKAGRIASVETWKLSRYMGTLERLKLVMDTTGVSPKAISKLHRFRFRTSSGEERVQRRMRKRGWADFVSLVEQTKPFWAGEQEEVAGDEAKPPRK